MAYHTTQIGRATEWFGCSDVPSQRHTGPYHQHLGSPGSWSVPPQRAYYICEEKYLSAAVTTVFTTIQHGGRTAVAIPMIARVSLVDYRGTAILDTYVRPSHPVSDFRAGETGIQYVHLANAPTFEEVQKAVLKITENKIIVGHSLWMFLSVLGLSHSALETRDLALYRLLRKRLRSKRIVSLSLLVRLFMNRSIGLYYENPLENARAAMDLFRSVEEGFEGVIRDGAWPCDLPPRSYLDYYL